MAEISTFSMFMTLIYYKLEHIHPFTWSSTLTCANKVTARGQPYTITTGTQASPVSVQWSLQIWHFDILWDVTDTSLAAPRRFQINNEHNQQWASSHRNEQNCIRHPDVNYKKIKTGILLVNVIQKLIYKQLYKKKKKLQKGRLEEAASFVSVANTWLYVSLSGHIWSHLNTYPI